jgi:hypothetical protein
MTLWRAFSITDSSKRSNDVSTMFLAISAAMLTLALSQQHLFGGLFSPRTPERPFLNARASLGRGFTCPLGEQEPCRWVAHRQWSPLPAKKSGKPLQIPMAPLSAGRATDFRFPA